MKLRFNAVPPLQQSDKGTLSTFTSVIEESGIDILCKGTRSILLYNIVTSKVHKLIFTLIMLHTLNRG
jgi:hypothetical protein